MSWWWAGAVGAARKKLDDGSGNSDSSAASSKFQSVGLIVGEASAVGASLAEILPLSDTPGGPWKVHTLPSPPLRHSLEHVERDSITHIFFVDDSDSNLETLRYVLSDILPAAKRLQHVCLQTGRRHYLGLEPPFHEDLPRTDSENPCYFLEDVLFEEIHKRGDVSWSGHRPTVIFGSTGLVRSLCAYAAVCKKEGVLLRWPGNRAQWEGFSDASDADLVAEQQIWAAVDPYAKDEAFNCSNGDVFKWKHMWKVLAEQFGVDWAGYESEERRFRLKDAMEGKGEVWEEIVKENELLPTKLGEVGRWGLVDEVFNAEACCLDSMNKSKEHGFLGFRNSVYSFTYWIDKVKAAKFVP
ncbi:3-oxo-Delta(4,5)-steroid 5-beta-reductase [Iris pallida]|uniref:3-oxo-Delta(4,5)-steroid 5-beta-reductase n=1 Tax=Iris pallida TaxID=29817 RepID=A0AAX6F6G2_IRIPA|nr:3-oxo-Delta(4,5)-steroid 5-beta-reductase [Iris pallida]